MIFFISNSLIAELTKDFLSELVTNVMFLTVVLGLTQVVDGNNNPVPEVCVCGTAGPIPIG